MEKTLRTLFCVDAETELKHWAEGQANGDAELAGLFEGGQAGLGYGALSGTAFATKKICVPQKIDPKTFFANERTFLKWLSNSMMIGGMAVALLGFANAASDGAQLAGVILLPVSVLFMFYALAVFRRRAHCIYMREPIRYDDTRGPTLLVVILAIALLLSAYFSLRHAVPVFQRAGGNGGDGGMSGKGAGASSSAKHDDNFASAGNVHNVLGA